MFPTTVLTMMSPFLMAVPWTRHLEDACKEASKEIQKKAKSTTSQKLTEQVVEKIICGQAGKLDKTLTKAATGALKKNIDKTKKAVEKDIEKKDPGSAQALDLTGLRDDLIKARKARDAMEPGKPVKLPKPQGGGFHVPIKVKVLTRDKIELEVNGFIGVDLKDLMKGKMPITYGGIGIGGKF
ncbi:MAG: hypothetical protein CML66_30350 [Rhodobacteraceae bacterium]|nr:hypothetical protein [Paracoccaceae bacterium]MAY45598.1 hypothetical protein [Paracoccaceae bacterium]QEW20655.1 hypothetical protein LA6_002854 [Marinibacterium anthonyi]